MKDVKFPGAMPRNMKIDRHYTKLVPSIYPKNSNEKKTRKCKKEPFWFKYTKAYGRKKLLLRQI